MRFCKTDGVIAEKIDGEYIVFNTDKESFFELDEVGSMIWELIDDSTIDQITNAVMSEYDISREQAQEDIRSFTNQLADNGLITVKETSTE